MKRSLVSLMLASTAWALGACTDEGVCDPSNPKNCKDGFVCEQVQGQEQSRCFAPVQVQGRVFNLSTGAGIPNALVAAVDPDGAPVGSQAVSGADGSFSLPIPSVRADEKGAPVAQRITVVHAPGQPVRLRGPGQLVLVDLIRPGPVRGHGSRRRARAPLRVEVALPGVVLRPGLAYRRDGGRVEGEGRSRGVEEGR